MARRELIYRDPNNRRQRHKRRHEEAKNCRRFSIVDWVMMVFSVAVAIGVVASCLARWIHPASYGFMSAAGLVVPVFFVANFLCLLYWVIRWRIGVFLPLAIFIAGLFGVTMFFKPHLTQSYANYTQDRSLVSVATYNVQGMMRTVQGSSGRLRSSMREVISVVDSLRTDILCMQEFQSTRQNPASRFEDALPVYNYKRTHFNIRSTEIDHGWGNAIYSKFPIVNSGHIDFDGTNNSILWADVAVNRDTIRVFNAHLQTTSIKAGDEQYIAQLGFVGDSTRTTRARQLLSKLTHNYIIRATQADTLATRIAASPHPVVVCGDFNDTPMSYSYNLIAHHLKDSFREAGQGYGYTYRGFFNLMRIDFVLHSRSLDAVDYLSPSFDNSDHNPVLVRLRF